jgi:hypothetical protein
MQFQQSVNVIERRNKLWQAVLYAGKKELSATMSVTQTIKPREKYSQICKGKKCWSKTM